MVKLFVVLPEVPLDGKIVWDPGYSSSFTGLQNVVPGGYVAPTSKPWVFKKDREGALQLAQEYSKTYNQPYYIAELQVQGRYAPPPPAYEPVFEPESNWKVPK